jgi:hypothetical protein
MAKIKLLELLAKYLTKNDYDRAEELINEIESEAYDSAKNY